MSIACHDAETAKAAVSRPLRFVGVGLVGFGVQALTLHALTAGVGLPPAIALVAAVEAAILHNFLWHEGWTWRDVAPSGGRIGRFARFNGVTALISILGNVGLTGGLVAATGWPILPANAVAVLALSLLNYLSVDHWVFSPVHAAPATRCSGAIPRAVALTFAVTSVNGTSAEAGPPSDATLAAWTRHVTAAEARIDESLSSPERFLSLDTLPADAHRVMYGAILRGEVPVVNAAGEDGDGEGPEMRGGMIHHWRGWLFIPAATVQDVVQGIVDPGGARAHQQEDVLEFRVLERRPQSLRIFLKLQRRSIVTVTYNTEHLVRYRLHTRDRASSRSVATRIRELADVGTPDERERGRDEDRGFLWGMNSYWRYQAVPGGVIVEMESLTLSRDLPWGVATIVRPLIDRVARESVLRTMHSIRTRFEPPRLAMR